MSLATAASPLRPARMIFAGPLVPRLVAGLAVAALWEIAVRLFMPDYVATPLGILAVFPHVVAGAPFLAALAQTMAAVAEGVLIAIVLGTALGLVIGRSVLAERALLYYVNAFYAMPILVMLPLFSLWFGYTSAARLATIVFSAIFSIVLNVADGARSMPKEYIETARSFRSGRFRELFEVVLPAAMPYVLAGLRLASGRALIGAVVAEFFTAIGGLGYFILFYSRTFHHNVAFVAVLFLAGFGVGADALITWGTRAYLPWYRRDEKAE